VKEVVAAAFAHRRKTLPNSLALAGLATRERAAEALAAIGRDPAARAEALAPPEFVVLTEALA
jgi:16S rRNA (adenine1518-N6/adenine1519-N6)-dimethyltransferase